MTTSGDEQTGEFLAIHLAKTGGDAGFDPVYNVVNKDGIYQSDTWYKGAQWQLKPSGSPYNIEVIDNALSFKGQYTLYLQRQSAATACGAVPLPCNTPIDGATDHPLQIDLFTVTTSGDEQTGEFLAIHLAKTGGDAGFDPVYNVVNKDGIYQSDTWYKGAQWQLKPSGSPYNIEVIDNALSFSGGYSLTVFRNCMSFRRGDVDASGVVELTDAVNTLGYLFLGNPATLSCFDAADADDNGILELTDAVSTLGYLFLGNPEKLPLPGPEACATDPTPSDQLFCESYPSCH